jgi:diguanylate cyclase (GGDEF)-like protein
MSTPEIEPPAPGPVVARRGDGLLIVLQNNDDKSLIISSINESLEGLLGYAKDEILNRRLETILGAREATAIAEDLEYENNAPDFGDIFSKIRDVRLRRRLGDEIRVNCTLSRLVSQGTSACFQIVIPDEQERLSRSKLTEFINLNLDGRKELDPATGLPNHKTATEFLPLLKNYFAESDANIVLAVIRLDRHKKSIARYGEEVSTQLLMHAYHICRSTFRSEDLIFALSNSTLGVVLFNISRESARVVLNRLRWKIRSHRLAFGGKQDFSVSTCIGFDLLDFDDVSGVFERCETTMETLDANERNALIELGNA